MTGSLTPFGLAGAVFLGALAGCWTGWNLTFAVLVTLALLLNINVRLFVLAAAAAAATAWAASPSTHDLGQWLLDEHPLGSFVGTYGQGPVGALLAWDVYTLVGATPFGLGLGLSGAVGALWMARRDACKQHLISCLGGDSGDDGCEGRVGTLRRFGLLMALAILPGWIAVTAAIVPGMVREAALAELTRENQAEVSVGDWEYRLWSGELRCEDVRFADPARPDFDRLRIDRVTAQLDAADVLRGRLHVRQLRLAGLATDRRRLEPAVSIAGARTTSAQDLAEPAGSGPEPTVADKTYHDALVIDVADAYVGWNELAAHARRFRTLCDVLVRCAGHSASSDDTSSATGTTCDVGGEYVALARVADEPQRCELDHGVTHTAADRIEIIGLPASWQLGDDAVVTFERSELQDIESDHGWDEHSRDKYVFRLRLTAPECASLELATDINLHDPAAPQPLWLSMQGVSAKHVAAWNVGGVRLTASQGTADVVGQGWVKREGLNLSLDVTGEQLAMSADTPAAARRPNGTATINFDVLAAAVAKTRRLALDARLDGSWQRPRMVVTPSHLLADLDYESLRAASERQLAQQDSATPQEPGDVGFRAPQPTAQPPVAELARPGAAQVARVAPPQSGLGMRVEVAQRLGVSIARPSRIYVEQSRQAAIRMPTGDTSPAGPTFPTEASGSPAPADAVMSAPITAQTTSPVQQASRRELLPPSWLKTGYDLGAHSTPTGRRWAAQQAEDRERAEKVLVDQPTLDTGQ